MQLSNRVENNHCIIIVEGNIALDGVSDVKAYVKPFLQDEAISGLVINFGKVDFIDSSGIGLIVSIFKTLQQRQAKLALCELSNKNKEIFNMTRLDKILSLFDTEAEAISSL